MPQLATGVWRSSTAGGVPQWRRRSLFGDWGLAETQPETAAGSLRSVVSLRSAGFAGATVLFQALKAPGYSLPVADATVAGLG